MGRNTDRGTGDARLHHKKDTTTTIEHAAAMIAELAEWLPERSFHLAADGAYATLAGAGLPRTQVTTRIRRDAALYEKAPPRTGKRGRPRTRGARLPTPAELANTASKTRLADRRGRRARANVQRSGLGPRRALVRVNKRDQLRLVIVRDPTGTEPDDFFVTTDLSATGAEIASRYAGRWTIEVCFRDVKQHLGAQNPQSWKRQGPERAAGLGLWLHALIWCWYLHAHPTGRTWIPRPWYTRKATPSFLDALAALRRTLWSQRITAMSTQAQSTPTKSPPHSWTRSPTPPEPSGDRESPPRVHWYSPTSRLPLTCDHQTDCRPWAFP